MLLIDIIQKVSDPLPMGKVRGIQLAITPLAIGWFLMLGWLAPWWLPVVLMVSMGVHEYGHVIMGQRLKYTAHFVLFEPMGARAVMEPRPQTASDDMWISLAGPVVNLVVGIVLLPVAVILYYSGFDGSSAFLPIVGACAINLLLFLFNMLPIYPLDGGRVFRAWAIKKYGWDRGSMLTRNVGLGVGAAMAGIFWFKNKRLSALLMLPYLHDCVRALRVEERIRNRRDPFDYMDDWAKHHKRQQES